MVTPAVGITIGSPVKIKPGNYILRTTESQPAIVVSANNITLDFSGVMLRGTSPETEPDQREGIGVLITGKNVTIKNLRAAGFRHAVIARKATGFKLLDSDLSYNWKQKLKSTPEKEDLSDWMSYHQNEKDEWLRWGTGLYLDHTDSFEIKNLTVEGGQNGVLMTNSNNGLIWNSNLNFLSAVGLGMYRSSNNRIMHNKIDWCVRGYSHGVYNRGQDSAGILIYEQSHKNTFAYNSVTHGGDGFFLWAGQSTMDDGKGGCNDNVVFGNDFSHAPTNGIETTFSRNVFANNFVLECWHGVWGGYSYDTKIVGNVFGLNAEGIAIEHGQDNEISGNVFRRENMALRIWSNATQDPNWGYPKHRDTASRDLKISNNIFFDTVGTVFNLSRSRGVEITGNFIKNNGRLFQLGEALQGVRFTGNDLWLSPSQEVAPDVIDAQGNSVSRDAKNVPKPPTMQPSGNVILGLDPDNGEYLKRFSRIEWSAAAQVRKSSQSAAEMSPEELRQTAAYPYRVAPLRGGNDPFLKEGTLRGRRFIIIDEWGPYDFKSPRMVLRSKDGNSLHFELLGPAGKWVLKSTSNCTVDSNQGSVPGFVDVKLNEGGNFDVQFEYRGKETVDYRGIRTAAGKPVKFGYTEFRIPIKWDIKFWNYDAQTQDPRTQFEAFDTVRKGKPAAEIHDSELNRAWGGSPAEGVNSDYFATVANGEFSVPAGDYNIEITSDDGVRVFLDDKQVHEDWTYHGPQSATVKVKLGGKHRLRVEHFELNGYSTLQVRIARP